MTSDSPQDQAGGLSRLTVSETLKNGQQSPDSSSPDRSARDVALSSSNTDDSGSRPEKPSNASIASLDEIIRRCRVLLSELAEFQRHIKAQYHARGENATDTFNAFSNCVKAEIKGLERLTGGHLPQAKVQHAATSSNLPFLEAVWDATKCAQNVVAMMKIFYWDKQERNSARNQHKGPHTTVDIVADGGLEWIKVSTITNTRLLFEKAKLGWEQGALSDEDDFSDRNADESPAKNGSDDAISIVKTARDLARAAQAIRVSYKHPRIKYMLPRIRPGQTSVIDEVLDDIRAAGVTVVCAEDVPPAPPLDAAFSAMTGKRFVGFSDVINIDCTILLAIVSDFSHTAVKEEDWFHTALKTQIKAESKLQLMPSILYPAMGSHALVCTRAAAKRMHEIVDTIGTESEKARTAIMMGTDASQTRQQLVRDFRHHSIHEIPADWQLPIAVADEDTAAVATTRLPAVAQQVGRKLTPINQSVFLYGWARGCTTITSNRTVVKQIEAVIDDATPASEDAQGPMVWLCPTARSLVGKEKNRCTCGSTPCLRNAEYRCYR
ncbi:hypothetical protein LTR66_010776 [Elasticomyces elasticus]|nr:hypothetical protein LTR66_010776 [Elasticomyces elasticus]